MMHPVEVTLPGGLPKGDCIARNVRFRPLTGRIEQGLLNINSEQSRPAYVTEVLSLVLDSIGDKPIDKKMLGDLCVADRQYLMIRLAALLDGEQMWLKINCAHCKTPFDVNVSRCDLPIKYAAQNFPYVVIQVNNHMINARIPTGSDQELILNQSEQDAIKFLLCRCVINVNGKSPDEEFFKALSSKDIDAIDKALDENSPAVCDHLLVDCPECGVKQQALMDHYFLPGIGWSYLYDEVHALASHYHWSEAEILDLPKNRRRIYLDKINQAAGINT